MDAIAGFVGDMDPERLRRMTSTMPHRGHWSNGQAVLSPWASFARVAQHDEGVGIPVGPRTYETPNYKIVLCGYVTRYNGSSVGDGPLLPRLLDNYHRAGLSSLSLLQGAYLVIILDCSSETLHVARDGAGMRTAFYGRIGDDWFVASEPKGITSEKSFEKRMRPAAIAQYLSFSFTPGESKMLTNLFEIPCGHAVSLRSGEPPRTTNLFPFEQEEPANYSDSDDDETWIARTRESVSVAVADRLPRGEPVGIFLSGGLDSSVIAAEVARQHDHKVLTYAIHFGDRYPHELDFARAVADRCGTEHHEVLIRPKDFAPRMREMIWHLDEPIGDPITQPNYELARRVSQDVRWVFNGEGGDPVFGGPKNIPMMMQHWYGVNRSPRFREQAYLASYRRAYDECTRVLHENVRSQIDWQRDLESILTPMFDQTSLRSFLNKLMAINIRLKGAHLILPKVERMLAACSLTPLSPLFDENFIRLSFQMPPRLKLRHGIEKWAMKRAYENDLPKEVIERPKSGMRVPVHYWFQGEMRRLARRTLARRPIERAEIFDPARIKQLLRYDTEEGPGRYGMRIWMLLTLEIWRRIVVEGEDV